MTNDEVFKTVATQQVTNLEQRVVLLEQALAEQARINRELSQQMAELQHNQELARLLTKMQGKMFDS